MVRGRRARAQIVRHHEKAHGSRVEQLQEHPLRQAVPLRLQTLAELFENEHVVRGDPLPRMPVEQRAEDPHGRLPAPPGVGHRVQQVAGREVVVDRVFSGLGRRCGRRPAGRGRGFRVLPRGRLAGSRAAARAVPRRGIAERPRRRSPILVKAGAQLDVSRALGPERQVEQRAEIHLVPRHARQDVRLVMHQPPFLPVPDHERGQHQIARRLPVPLALPEHHRFRGVARLFGAVGHDPAFQALQTLQAEALADLREQVRAAPLEAEDVALVQPGHAGLLRAGLPEDAADELRQRALRAGVRQDREDVGERAVPAFLQRLLGDDEADRALAGEEAAGFVHLLQPRPAGSS